MDIVTLALAKKYTEETAISFGAVKGAPCMVSGSSKDSDGNTVLTLTWKNESGETRTQNVTITKGNDGRDGVDGISITEAKVDENNHLIITYSDGTELDAGKIDTTEGLSQDLTATVAIGTVTSGKKYAKGTSLEAIIRDILIKEVAPSVSLTLNPTKLLYDVVTENITTIKLVANVTKGTYTPSNIKFYVGATEVDSKSITSEGSYAFVYNPATPIKVNTVFKAVVTDGKLSSESSKTVKFVSNSYYGTVDSTVSEPKESEIKVLQNKTLKDVKDLTYSGINMDYGKVVYAYPVSFGALTSIKDPVNNYNYFSSFARTTTKVDNIDYYVYTQIDPSASEDVKLVFA